MTSGRRAYIYTRLSRDKSGEGLGTASQEAECRKLADLHGFEVLGVFTDLSISAWSGKRRPGYERLLEVIRAGETDVVITWSLDRLSRNNLMTAQYAQDCRAHNVFTYTVQGAPIDLSTPQGQLLATQLAGIAQYEADIRSERVKLAKQRLAAQGAPSGGRRPFGWEQDGITQVPAEADAIKWAVAEILGGGSLTGVAREWRERGLTSTVTRAQVDADGNTVETRVPMSATGVRDILLRPRNAGLRQHRGKITEVPAQWKPLVTRGEWEAMSRILGDPARRSSFTTQPKYLLTGIARCVCGTTVSTRKGGRAGQLVYACNRNARPAQATVELEQHVSVRLDLADRYIEDVLLGTETPDDAWASEPDRMGAAALLGYIPPGEESEPTPPDLAVFNREQEELFADLKADVVTQDEFLTQLNEIRGRRTLAESSFADALARWTSNRDRVVFATDPRAAWESWSLERRRRMLTEFTNITVLPAPRRGRNPDISERFEITFNEVGPND